MEYLLYSIDSPISQGYINLFVNFLFLLSYV